MELDDRIATAAEKAPTEDKLIKLLRESSDVRKNMKVLIHEEKVREAGYLYVIGTEAESRRVDNQLRGRAGRQADLTRFLSLEDNLLRIFGGDRVAMNAFRVDEDSLL